MNLRFYHEMLRSARYCYGKVVHPSVPPSSVCLSVRDIEVPDHIGWNSYKVIGNTLNFIFLIFVQ